MNPIASFIDQLNTRGLWEKQICVNRNEFLTVRGSRDTNIYFITSGSLRVFVDDVYEEHIIRLAYQNDIILALDAFISDKPTDFYIQAIKRSVMNVISKAAFMNFVHSSPDHILAWTA